MRHGSLNSLFARWRICVGPNPLNHRDDYSRPALRYGSSNSLFYVASYLPSYEQVENLRSYAPLFIHHDLDSLAYVSWQDRASVDQDRASVGQDRVSVGEDRMSVGGEPAVVRADLRPPPSRLPRLRTLSF